MSEINGGKLLIQADVARLKKVTRQSVSLAVKDGRLPSIEKDGKRYISAESAAAWRPMKDAKARARKGVAARWKGHTPKGPYQKKGRRVSQKAKEVIPEIDNPYLESAIARKENSVIDIKKRGRAMKA